MAIFYNEGEVKTRPGVYQRHTNSGFNAPVSSQDGFCAIPVQAAWGPLGKVVRNIVASDLTKNYGSGTYGTGHTVPAAAAMFDGGASVVYTYRLGSGGEKASKEITSGLTATAKYPGTMAVSIAVQEKLGDATVKKFQVYAGNSLVEEFSFAADGKTEGANLIAAAKNSKYVDVTGAAETVPVLAVASGALEGGVNPTVTNEDYSKAFAAFEPFWYNTITLDVDDPDMTLSLLLASYLANAYKLGKLGIAVVGDKTTVDFETRCAHAKAFNDCKVVYLGGGWMSGTENKDGVMAICYTAGLIAATPSNQGIVHTVINGATELCESLTNAQHVDAINAGMLMVSMSSDGSIWFDSGVNTHYSRREDSGPGLEEDPPRQGPLRADRPSGPYSGSQGRQSFRRHRRHLRHCPGWPARSGHHGQQRRQAAAWRPVHRGQGQSRIRRQRMVHHPGGRSRQPGEDLPALPVPVQPGILKEA